MTLDGALRIALDLAFFATFGVALRDYLAHRTPVRRAVLLTFGSFALVLGITVARNLVPGIPPVVNLVVVPAFLAHPLLVLWLVHHFRPVSRVVFVAGGLGFAALTVLLLLRTVAPSAIGGQNAAGLALATVGYFLGLELIAASGLAVEARRRRGAARVRLGTAAASTATLGIGVVIILVASLAIQPGGAAQGALQVIGRVMSLVAAIGYLVAFATPHWLRNLSRQATTYEFIRHLNALPTGTPPARIWELLAETAAEASGAEAVDLVLDPRAGAEVVIAIRGGPASGRGPARTIAVPLRSQRWPDGYVELVVGANDLFVDDDVVLISLLAERAARAAEREAVLGEREILIAELRAASAAKSEFMAAMSHELRTPLNAIIGFSELLGEAEEAADRDTVRTYAEHIHGSGLHLLELVNDVLDLARVEAGRLDLRPAPFDLSELVRRTVDAMRPLAAQKGLTLDADLPAELEIEADPGRVRQVVFNLLSNAVKFTETGRVGVRVEDAGAEDVRLRVTDTGSGIEADDVERIFEAFRQGRGTRHEGTGLGLALTRQLVEAHGGTVQVESTPGAGSTFTVRLPRRRAPATGAVGAAPEMPGGRASVLVIEDDPAAAELLGAHLDAAGFGFAVATSGQEGVEWAGKLRPDAILLDILLPDIDGWEVLQRLKADPRTRAIPVMVVSVVDDRELGLALGAVDYFVKPVSRDRLLEALGRLTFTTKVRTRTVTALVIDADPAAEDRYRELLEPEGFRVLAATDAESGAQRAREDRPDLILLDVLLPDSDGLELTARLKRDPSTAAIPIWVTTPGELPAADRSRLNGHVLGVVERGDDAIAALRSWLERGSAIPESAP